MDKQKILLLLAFLPIFSVNAQYKFYYPDGKIIDTECKTIQCVLDSLGIKETETYHSDMGDIYFKRLTNIPVFIITNKTNPTLIINNLISSYNKEYKKYLYSYSYYYDLKDMMKNNTLTKDYLIDAFGEPSSIDSLDYETAVLIFKKYNAKIEFIDNVVVALNVINYNAFEKHNLSISDYRVLGGDYTIGFSISVSNYAEKTIKYISFTVKALNPVDDIVATKTVRGVGPIEKGRSASYEFEDIIYSNTAKYLNIESVKIQYMDGTIYTIPKSAIHDITVHNWGKYGE
jgi:hypothetical protein